jgi:hypothetical protein
MVKRGRPEVLDLRSVLRTDCVAAFDSQRLATRLLSKIRPAPIGLRSVTHVDRANLRHPAVAAYLFALEGLSRVTAIEADSTRSVVENWTRLSYQAQELRRLGDRARKSKRAANHVRAELRRIDRRPPTDSLRVSRDALQAALDNLESVSRTAEDAGTRSEEIISYFHSQGVLCRSLAVLRDTGTASEIQALTELATEKVQETEHELAAFAMALKEVDG